MIEQKQQKKSLQNILDNVMVEEGACMGNIRRFDPISKSLLIVVHKGFKNEFLKRFKFVKPFDSTACGRAFGIGNMVLIEDVEEDLVFEPHMLMARKAGFRAIKSVPIISNRHERLGVISTHYEKPRSSWNLDIVKNYMPDLVQALKEYTSIAIQQVQET